MAFPAVSVSLDFGNECSKLSGKYIKDQKLEILKTQFLGHSFASQIRRRLFGKNPNFYTKFDPGTHQFDLFCSLTHRLYFDLNFSSTLILLRVFGQTLLRPKV